jgi:hypothetical protein
MPGCSPCLGNVLSERPAADKLQNDSPGAENPPRLFSRQAPDTKHTIWQTPMLRPVCNFPKPFSADFDLLIALLEQRGPLRKTATPKNSLTLSNKASVGTPSPFAPSRPQSLIANLVWWGTVRLPPTQEGSQRGHQGSQPRPSRAHRPRGRHDSHRHSSPLTPPLRRQER